MFSLIDVVCSPSSQSNTSKNCAIRTLAVIAKDQQQFGSLPPSELQDLDSKSFQVPEEILSETWSVISVLKWISIMFELPLKDLERHLIDMTNSYRSDHEPETCDSEAEETRLTADLYWQALQFFIKRCTKPRQDFLQAFLESKTMDIIMKTGGITYKQLEDKDTCINDSNMQQEDETHMNMESSSFGLVPMELIYHIFHYLPGRELLRITRVCKLWRSIGRDILHSASHLQRLQLGAVQVIHSLCSTEDAAQEIMDKLELDLFSDCLEAAVKNWNPAFVEKTQSVLQLIARLTTKINFYSIPLIRTCHRLLCSSLVTSEENSREQFILQQEASITLFDLLSQIPEGMFGDAVSKHREKNRKLTEFPSLTTHDFLQYAFGSHHLGKFTIEEELCMVGTIVHLGPSFFHNVNTNLLFHNELFLELFLECGTLNVFITVLQDSKFLDGDLQKRIMQLLDKLSFFQGKHVDGRKVLKQEEPCKSRLEPAIRNLLASPWPSVSDYAFHLLPRFSVPMK